MTAGDTAVVAEAYEKAPFKISRHRWRRLLAELRRRGAGHRESGAFLLVARGNDRVVRVAYYDDLDAHCLTGGISFATSGFTELWRICGEENLRVVADVHTHPGTWVQQSEIDATNPMMARVGHVAMIVPSYGGARSIGECGVHIYLGSRRWIAVPADESALIVDVYRMFSTARAADWWRAMAGVLGRTEKS